MEEYGTPTCSWLWDNSNWLSHSPLAKDEYQIKIQNLSISYNRMLHSHLWLVLQQDDEELARALALSMENPTERTGTSTTGFLDDVVTTGGVWCFLVLKACNPVWMCTLCFTGSLLSAATPWRSMDSTRHCLFLKATASEDFKFLCKI